MGKNTFELDWYIIFYLFPLPSHSCLQMFEDWCLFLLCSVDDENYRVESMCLIHLYSCQSFTTPRLSISHAHSSPKKEDGGNDVSSTKFLGVHITEDLTWTTNTKSISKKAQQRLHFLRRLKRASLPPPILTTFYRGTIESVLTSCITVWYGNCCAADRKTLQRTVKHRCKNHWCPSPLHPGHFPYTMLQQSKKYRGGPHPPLPQSLPAPTLR